jgi:NADPH-dependent curcumin reductase CurA
LLKDLGFDGAFNYNTQDLSKALSEVAPEGIDIYFDNVGGPTLEVALQHMRKYGRVIMCGSISNYNKGGWEASYGVRNLFNITGKSLKLQGFIVTDRASEFASGTQRLVGWVVVGKLKVKETIVDGFENIPKAFMGLFTGDNQGKMVVKV